MTHLHIPDGILPVWLWLSGFIAMFAALALSIYRLKKMDMRIKIPLLGTLCAAMLVSMSLEIAPLAYHINLSVVAGILLGPALGFVAAFITNFILALIGHGGITVMGLNTLLLGTEAVLGHTFFTVIGRRLPLFWRAAAATVLTLMVTTGLLIGIVAVSSRDTVSFLEYEVHGTVDRGGPVSIGRFAAMAVGLGSLGWILEAAITGSVIRFIAQVKPDLLQHVLHSGTSRQREGEGE